MYCGLNQHHISLYDPLLLRFTFLDIYYFLEENTNTKKTETDFHFCSQNHFLFHLCATHLDFPLRGGCQDRTRKRRFLFLKVSSKCIAEK